MIRSPIKIHLQQRNDVYYLRYKIPNLPEKKVSTKSKVYDEAYRKKIELENKLNSGEYQTILPVSHILFKDIIKEYIENYVIVHLTKLTSKDYLNRIKILLSYFGSKTLVEITSLDIRNFINNYKKQRNVKNATLNRFIALFSSIFNYAIKQGYIKFNPVSKVDKFKEPNNSRDFDCFKDDEIKKIVKASSPLFRPLVMTAFYSGMRKGEIIGLRWDNVDFDRNVIKVVWSYDTVTKGKEVRIVGMHTKLRKELLIYKEIAVKSIYVFPNHKGKMRNNYNKVWKNTLKRAEVDYRNFHVTRHTFATIFLREGSSLAYLQQILGHSNIKTTMRYSHLGSEYIHLRNAINKIAI